MDTARPPDAPPRAVPLDVPQVHVVATVEREAIRFLRDELLPRLKRTGNASLVRPVERAVAAGHLETLAHLPEPRRRELLEFLDAGLPAARRFPRAVVALTSAVAQLPPPGAGTGRRLSSPAR